MRLAVLSDIHGNLLAVEAVIADLRAQAPDLVLNLGDHVSGPLQAAATADLLMSQRDWVHIRGNHDRQMSDYAPDGMGLSDRAAHAQIADAHRTWLRGLPPAATICDGILLCHGTPQDDTDYLLEEVSACGVSLAAPESIRRRAGATAAAILCGHSHLPHFVRMEDGAVILNPGSVGLQAYYDAEYQFPHAIENGSPHARYAILDRKGKSWGAALRMVEYDWDAAAELAQSRNRPDWAHALVTGYALR